MTPVPATRIVDNAKDAVDVLLERSGERIVCATPLGLGKPVELLNALYRRIGNDNRRKLTIMTALSLAVPRAGSDLERRFLEPFARRVFAGVPELDYLADLSRQRVPPNIDVLEFYFRPGSMLSNPVAQQNHISANYTHVARDVVKLGCNAVLVMVSERDGRYSLSCNPDLALDVVRMLRERGKSLTVIAQVNRNLPFMAYEAEVGPEFFDVIVDSPELETRLFGVPNSPAVPADHAVGVHAASLVRDGGTLQLGIGSLGDAVAHWLRARHKHSADFRQLADALGMQRYEKLIDAEGGTGGFEQGLFAGSEMFTWGLMELYQAGVLKRRVYENAALQDALNRDIIGETFAGDVLERLHAGGVIGNPLLEADVEWLRYFGVLEKAGAAGTRIADVPRDAIGTCLLHGHILHGAFLLGPEAFYEALHNLPEDERQLFNMMPVSKVNDLFGEEALERLQRRHARFINICMKVTLFGAAVSDGLEDGRIISGVGGQYNFVAMAHELEGARSILCLRATRTGSDGLESNIVFNYGHTTIPRHLRDIVITEYGIADLRGRTDAECAMAMIEIADSRFQEALRKQAQQAGKLPGSYEVPAHARNNTPGALWQKLEPLYTRGLLPAFPLGTDFDPTEQRLVHALSALKKVSGGRRGKLKLVRGILSVSEQPDDSAALIRMGLASPGSLKEKLLQRVVIFALRLSSKGRLD